MRCMVPARCAAHRGERCMSASCRVGTSLRAKRGALAAGLARDRAAAKTDEPSPGIPYAAGSLDPPGGLRSRSRMSMPRDLRSSPHRLAQRWRGRLLLAIGESRDRNRKLWGDLGISLSIRNLVQRFIHTCCTAPKRHDRHGAPSARGFVAKSVQCQGCQRLVCPQQWMGERHVCTAAQGG